MKHMSTVGVRALKQNASAVVARAESGEVVTITDHGRPVAQLVPLRRGVVQNLVIGGRARLARRAISDLEPTERRSGDPTLSKTLDQMRESERY